MKYSPSVHFLGFRFSVMAFGIWESLSCGLWKILVGCSGYYYSAENKMAIEMELAGGVQAKANQQTSQTGKTKDLWLSLV